MNTGCRICVGYALISCVLDRRMVSKIPLIPKDKRKGEFSYKINIVSHRIYRQNLQPNEVTIVYL